MSIKKEFMKVIDEMHKKISKEEFIKIIEESGTFINHDGEVCRKIVPIKELNKDKFKQHYNDIVGFNNEEDEASYKETGFIYNFDVIFEQINDKWSQDTSKNYVEIDGEERDLTNAIDFVLYDFENEEQLFFDQVTDYDTGIENIKWYLKNE